jgi:PAS domain S-box-containing protein
VDSNELHPLNLEGGPSTAQVRDDLFATAVTSTRMSMVIADPNQHDCPIIYCNQAFLDLTGYREDEVLGRNCRFLQGPDTDPATVQRIRQALAAGQDVHEDILNYRKDGSYFWSALQINAIADEQDRVRYFFASQKDITRQREAVFRQGQRMESLGALASGIAHEVSNLMTVVVGSIEGAAARAADQRQAEQLRRADWAARRTGELATALLAMARRQDLDETPIDVNEAISELQGTFNHSVPEGTPVDLELAPTPIVARLDSVQLDLVVLNLIRNAAEAMPNGGTVIIRTRVLPPPEATDILGLQNGVELAVSDTGVGMSPEVARRATEAFFTTKGRTGASGLGLFVAVSFAEQSGGRLLLETEQGRGTTVRIVVPREGAA